MRASPRAAGVAGLDQHWYPVKRADLVLALDTAENGVHAAAIELKARRSDAQPAADGRHRPPAAAAQRHALGGPPEPDTIYIRLSLNGIAEVACAVARESSVRLTGEELAALEQLRPRWAPWSGAASG